MSGLGGDVRRMREDGGVSLRRLATVAGVAPSFLSAIERGLREPSLTVLVAIAEALGADLSARLYPSTGPRIRDAFQARMVEALLAVLHVSWARHLEVPVYRPVRGVIDLVLRSQSRPVVLACEAQSELRRLEQQLRWAHEKADALPSATISPSVPTDATVDRLLLLRNTRANRQLVERFAQTFKAEYPASSIDAYRALTDPDHAWPGSALLWVRTDGDEAMLLPRPPRGVSVGR